MKWMNYEWRIEIIKKVWGWLRAPLALSMAMGKVPSTFIAYGMCINAKDIFGLFLLK